MLSRIARGLYDLGRYVERAQHVVRILEVNHKMNLEGTSADEANVWTAISEAFDCGLDQPDEAALHRELVLSRTHPWSVFHCIASARDRGRAMREHVSEEMWIHLNRTWLDLAPLGLEEILRVGRSEFNRRIEVFGGAFYGLADDTMIRGESWAFLRIGKLVERAAMICRILDIHRKSLTLAPESEEAPLDVRSWQALLRSLSGYEPYRRAYDARIVPERVLEFVTRRPDFPRSLASTLSDLGHALDSVPRGSPLQTDRAVRVDGFLEDLNALDPRELVRQGSLDGELRRLAASGSSTGSTSTSHAVATTRTCSPTAGSTSARTSRRSTWRSPSRGSGDPHDRRREKAGEAGMDNVGIVYEHYAGEPMWLHVTGPLRPGWCGNLAAGLAARGLGIVRAHAVALAAGSWDARFELRCPPDRTPGRGALRRMLETDAGAGFGTPLPLVGFALAPSESRGGCLRLDVAGEDGVGFLAALLRRLAFHSLFPVELGLDTVQGQARNRLWLRGAGGTRPLPRAQVALRASLEALVRVRGGRGSPAYAEQAVPG